LATRLEELQRGAATGPCCLALADLDFFKRVNDELGHVRGDHVLRSCARRLRASVRAGDIVARVGGDEFGILLNDVPPREACSVVERVRGQMACETDDPAGGTRRITASVGYVVLGPDWRPLPAQAMEVADRWLRQAKAAGRDRSDGDPAPRGAERP
jgi:diguanylate cyclase (GGDEF)-like protein